MKFIALLFTLFIFTFSFSQSWQDVGGGTNNSSHGMLTWNGKLINLGSYNSPCNRVAEWDGVSWNCLSGGVGLVARAGVVWDGKLVVVGDFWNVQQPCVGCNGVAVWDGVSWSPLGNGVNNDVLSITVWNNELVIAGDFTQANGVPVARIVKWNGSIWESVGPIGVFDNDIRAMVEFEDELWVGGDFNNVGGCSACDGLVKYDPGTASWVGGNSGVDLIGGVNESVRVLYVNPNDGNLYMGGEFPELHDGDAAAPDFNMGGVAMYDGSNWTPLGTGLNDYCRAMHEYNGDLIVGGIFTDAGGTPANKIAKWNPVTSTWTAMGMGFDLIGIDEYVKSATVWNGIFFAGGAYTQAEGNPMNYIAQWYEAPTAPPVAWINSSSSTLCGSGCIDFLDNSTNAPTSWTWTFPGSNTPTSNAMDPGSVCWSASGTYNVSLQACNAFGCNTQFMAITVDNGATITVNDASICDGGTATLTAVPSIGGGTYLWSPGGATSASINVSPASTTVYTVQYSNAGCVAAANSTVTVGTTPSVTLNTASASICEGSSVLLTATPSAGGGTYLWSPTGETTASVSASPASSSSYSVEYTLNGCTSLPVICSITVNSTPTASVNDESICDGGSATLIATPSAGGGTYLWSPGGETTSSITESPASTTSYSVVYTLNGCPSASEMGTITVGTTPTISVNNETICSGASATLIATPLAGGGTYLWSPGGETISSITESPATTTSYSVVYTLNGCSSTSEIGTITVNPTPTVSVNNETICSGESATLIATPSVGGGTYSWSPGGETTSSITESPGSTASYSIIYLLNGCESNPEIGTITVNPTPTVSVNNETICPGGFGLLIATPSIGGGTYLWSPGGETISSITESPATTTSYSVVYILNGCSSTSEIGTITVNPTPTLSVNNETICSGESATLVATPSVGGGTYSWSPGGETTSSITESPASTTSYSIIYLLNGCESNPEIGTITVNPTPTVSVNNETICDGGSATLIATPSVGGGTYLWSPGGETTSSITESPVSTTSYAVIYTLNGCPSNSEMGTISVGVTPTVSVNNETICSGESSTLIATPSLGGGTYLWSPGGETTSSITEFPASTASYSVVYTLNGCPSTSEIGTITVNPTPTVSVSNETICSGESATLIATPSVGGGTYSWSPGGETTSSITEFPASTASYSVVYTLNGCPSTSEMGTITVNPTPTVSVNNETICPGESATLIATPSVGGGTYSWSPGGETTSSIIVSPLSSDSYSVTYTLNGCESIPMVSTVTVSTSPDIYTTEANNVITADQVGAIYQWLDCNTGNAEIPGETAQSYVPVNNGSYAVQIELNGCIDTSACTIISTIGIDELSMNKIYVFPNPVNDVLHIQSSTELTNLHYQIIDVLGREIRKGIVTAESIIDVSEITEGSYSIRFNDGLNGIIQFVKL